MDKWLIRNVTKAEQQAIYGALGYEDKLIDYHTSIYPAFPPKFSETLSFSQFKSHHLPQLQERFHQYLKLQIPFNKVVQSGTFPIRYYSVLVTSTNCSVSNEVRIAPHDTMNSEIHKDNTTGDEIIDKRTGTFKITRYPSNDPYFRITGSVVDTKGNNPFHEYSSINKHIRSYFNRTNKFNGMVLGSVIENPINSDNISTGQKYINVHLHLLVQVCSKRNESSAIQKVLQHLVNKQGEESYSVRVRPYRDKYSHELIELTDKSTPSDTDRAYQSLSRFLLGYFNKQRNKLPASLGDLSAWKRVPQPKQKNILLSIYNSISKHINPANDEVTKGVRLHYQYSFKRANRRMKNLIKFNREYWSNKLNRVVHLDLITREFAFWERIKRVTTNYASNLEQNPTPENMHITGASKSIPHDSLTLSIDSS